MQSNVISWRCVFSDWLVRIVRHFIVIVFSLCTLIEYHWLTFIRAISSSIRLFISILYIMDQVQQFTEPCKQFMKDSIRLVKKCTKPDRKGNSWLFVLLNDSFHLSLSIRISKNCYGNSNWFCYHGIYWFLR